MNTVPNTQDRPGTDGASCRSGRRWQPWWLGRGMPVGPWLVVLVAAAALVASGCGGGGGEEEAEPEEAATETEPADMGGAPPEMAAKPKPKEAEKPEEKAVALPDEISEWVTEHYYQARKDRDPRLVEAVAHLGEEFAGTDNADTAAQLLTNLLKKSEAPPPKPKPAQAPGMPGMPGMEEGMGGMEPDMAGMEPDMAGMEPDMGGMPDDMGGMPEDMAAMEAEMAADMAGMEGAPMGSRMPGLRRVSRPTGVEADLIYAIVEALGVNGSKTAKATLTQVIEDKFETDDNQAATLAALETMVAHLNSDYEALLLRCLTTPVELRPLGRGGQMGRAGGMPGAPGMGRQETASLTAEHLQQEAFELIAPKASEEFRAKIAKHLADPNTPQEDLDLFGPYLRESDPENLQAQMVLFLVPDIAPEAKEMIEDNFLAFSSDALAGVLGIPEEYRAEAARRRELRKKRGRGHPEMPGMGAEPMLEEEAMMDPAMAADMAAEMGADPGMPGARPGASRPRSGRRSRYDTQSTGRPSRYDDRPGAAGQQGPEPDTFDARDPDLPFRLAQRMWSPEMVKLVEGRLAQVSSLEDQAPLVLLASTMPVDSVRSSLHRLLQQHWQDGPDPLESAGLYDYVVSDPAFLALVKMLPRKAPEEPKKAVPTLSRLRSRRGRGQGDQRGGPEMPGEMAAEEPGAMMGPGVEAPGRGKPEEPDLAWMAASEELVRVVCDRLFAAAQATGGQPGQMPFEIRDDALVTAELHLDWPASPPKKLAGVTLGQMKLHYARAECQSKIGTLESFFRRKLGSPEIRPIQDGSWIDSVEPLPDSKLKRSIDLLLTATVPAGEELDKKAELPVTLDILCIDIQDPAPGGQGN